MTITHICSIESTSKLSNVSEDMIQPNAVDLRLNRVWGMSGDFLIDEENKFHRVNVQIEPDNNGYFVLAPGAYQISFDHNVEVGGDEAGFVITRSTLNRNGIFITSGLYDSGYNGSMAACLHVNGGIARIKKGTRIGQYVNWKATALHSYSGDYGFDENGKPKAMEAQYHQ